MEAIDIAVSLTVQDLEKSLVWYRDVLGFAVTLEHVRAGKRRAVSLDSEPADGFGARVFRLRDPDGFKFTISSERGQ